jgi:hypothetical protein
MSSKARATDRRHGERFEVLGSLPARITVLRRLLVRNLGCGGLLVQSPPALPLPLQMILLESSEATVRLQARVVRNSLSPANEFSTAMEFTDLDPASLAQLREMMCLEADGE